MLLLLRVFLFLSLGAICSLALFRLACLVREHDPHLLAAAMEAAATRNLWLNNLNCSDDDETGAVASSVEGWSSQN
jgi:hypothetical protein